MSDTNSAAFLNAFIQIEKHIRRLANGRREEPFSALLAKVAGANPVVRRFADDLREYADLRNAIVHERRGGDPIAEPHQKTVEHLQTIAAVVLDPPRVNRLGTMKVVTCAPDTPIGAAAREMRSGAFSQLPVYEGREFVGLLTSETIARWLGAELEHHDGILEDQPVSAVLSHREASGVEEFVSRDTVIAEVIELFEATVRSGKDLDAVLVTQNGMPRESPIHILTVFDLPRLYDLAAGRNAA